MTIVQFAEKLSGVLKIKTPDIQEVSAIHTGGQMAVADAGKWSIIVRYDIATLDKAFSVAHEMRHLWQSQYATEMFDDYVSCSNLDDEAYNLQEAEIDANAFGAIIMTDVFGLSPRLDGLSAAVKQKIFARADEIAKSLQV